MSKDTLAVLGHENPVVRLEYTRPLPVLRFPFKYGDKDSAVYTSEVLYSAVLPMRASGYLTTTADAYGRMSLPDDVTLDSVLRVKTVQVIENIPLENSSGTEKQQTTTETYRWYLKGYRYPVFETVKGLKEDGSELFATAFYFPLQEHLYLEDDPENALPEKGWDPNKSEQSPGPSTSTLFGSAYRFYPNPTRGMLYIDLSLEATSDVDIILYSADGRVYKQIHRENRDGSFYESIDCSGLPGGTYLLKLIYGRQTATGIVIKK